MPFSCSNSIEKAISHRGVNRWLLQPGEPLKTNFSLEEGGNLLSISTSRAVFRGPLVLLASANEIALYFSFSSKQREGTLTSWQKASVIPCASCLINTSELWSPPVQGKQYQFVPRIILNIVVTWNWQTQKQACSCRSGYVIWVERGTE